MRRLLSLSTLVLLALVSARAGAGAEAPAQPATKPVVVPFEMLKTGHMTVMVKVNGQGPYRLIFDTGAPITLLNNRIAKATGLLKNVPRPLFAPFGSMGEVKVKTLHVGDQEVKDTSAIVMDHPTVEAISRVVGQIDGIVGFPFFARFNMKLNYQAKTMTFVPSGYQPPDIMRAMMSAMLMGQQQQVLAPRVQLGLVPRKQADDQEPGVTVEQVLAGSPAAKAGLKKGDRLLTLDDRWTDSVLDVFSAADHLEAGKSVEARIRRDGKEMTVSVTPTPGL